MEKLSDQIRVFVHTIGRAGERRFELAGLPINLKQQSILTMLSKSEEMFQTVLAEVMQKDKSAVLREIDALESLGLVLRSNDAIDRRKKRILMTPAGHEMFRRGQEIVNALMADLTQGISPEELAAFGSTLERIARNGDFARK